MENIQPARPEDLDPLAAEMDGAMNLDYSVYPDVDVLPKDLPTPEDKADYVSRICYAWDFGIVPTPETFELFAGWKEVFDEFVVPHSPAYAHFVPTTGGRRLRTRS